MKRSVQSTTKHPGRVNRTAAVAVLLFLFGVLFQGGATPVRGESGEILSYGQNNFTAGVRWHSFFCVDGEVCRLADVNGDGVADAVAFDQTRGRTWVALGLPHEARFGPASIWAQDVCRGDVECRLADVTGNGRADLLVFDSSAGLLRIAPSDGTAFGAAITVSLPNCLGTAVCTAGDVNGDGVADLIVFKRSSDSSEVGAVYVSLAQPLCSPGVRVPGVSGGSSASTEWCSPAFQPPALWHNFFCIANEVCDVGDFNGDGRADIVVFAQGVTGGVWVALADRVEPRFGRSQLMVTHLCADGSTCAVGDVNGDGLDDLISFAQRYTGGDSFRPGEPGGDVFVSLSRRNLPLVGGGIAFGPPLKRHDWFCVTGETCAVGDVNGDGRTDIVAFVGDAHPARRGHVYVAHAEFGKTTSWELKLESLRVVHGEESYDEPYLISINFRSTFGRRNSTEIWSIYPPTAPYRWAWSLSPADGPRAIPAGTGGARFTDVRLPTLGDLLNGAPLEVMGTVILAMESDSTPWSYIEEIVRKIEEELRTDLRRLVEGRNLILNPDLVGLNREIEAAQRRITDAVKPGSLAEILRFWVGSFYDPDEVVGVYTFVFLGIDKEADHVFRFLPSIDSSVAVFGESFAARGQRTVALQCRDADCRVDPEVRYDLTVSVNHVP